MCYSLADGGQRCAAHTRPAYQRATFGTPEWDEAAAQYASTQTGRMELAASLAAAEAAEDVKSAVAIEHAMEEGRRIREKNALAREFNREESAAVAAVVAEDDAAARFAGERWDNDGGHNDDDPHEDDEDDIAYYMEEDEDLGNNAPRMPTVAPTFNRHDPAFNGCSVEGYAENPDLVEKQFVEQVCANYGITVEEYEAQQQAENIQNLRDALTGANGVTGSMVGATGVPVIRGDAGQVVRSFNPQRIKWTAEAARDRKMAEARERRQAEERAAREAEQAQMQSEDDIARNLARDDDTDRQTLIHVFNHTSDDSIKADVARHPNIDGEDLDRMSRSTTNKVRAGAARNPNLPEARIRELAQDRIQAVQGMVARNPSTPDDVYEALATSPKKGVRSQAAFRKTISMDWAETLSHDSESGVRSALARNRQIQQAVLDRLARDEEGNVRTSAFSNPNISEYLLGDGMTDPVPGVRAEVARNPIMNSDAMRTMSNDSDHWVLQNVARNPNTPDDVMERLARHEDSRVAAAAEKAREQRASR